MEEHGVTDLPTTAQHTITEMVYQLGPTGVSKFRNMWKCPAGKQFYWCELRDARLEME